MIEIVNKLLLARYKFMHDMHLRELPVLGKSGFT